MAHDVELGIAAPVPIGNVDVSLKVKKDGRLLGTLQLAAAVQITSRVTVASAMS
jgi:hypothetical protein